MNHPDAGARKRQDLLLSKTLHNFTAVVVAGDSFNRRNLGQLVHNLQIDPVAKVQNQFDSRQPFCQRLRQFLRHSRHMRIRYDSYFHSGQLPV
ncbi:hypothetical protein D3C71_1595530 [compost metagenome]